MSPSYALPDYLEPVPNVDQDQTEARGASRTARALRQVSAGSKLLLASIVSALLVGANQLVESWTDGNLITAWIALWALAFAALALLAGPSRRAAASLGAALKAQRARREQAEQDQRYWELALNDPRLMAEIRRAMGESAAVPYAPAAMRDRWLTFTYVPSF